MESKINRGRGLLVTIPRIQPDICLATSISRFSKIIQKFNELKGTDRVAASFVFLIARRNYYRIKNSFLFEQTSLFLLVDGTKIRL